MVPGLQGAFIDTVRITVSTAEGLHPSGIRAYEPTPFTMSSYLNPWYVTESVMDLTLSTAPSDNQLNLWIENGNNSAPTAFSAFYTLDDQGLQQSFVQPTTFTTAFPVGTHTRVLQVPGLRIRSTVDCKNISASAFPTECSGPRPFNTTYSPQGDEDESPTFQFRLCAPGEFGYLPWKNTIDKQNISEKLFMDYQAGDTRDSFTYHCVANSTMGYFELPNQWNDHKAGDVFDVMPGKGYSKSE